MTRLLMTADAVGGVWTYAVELARGLAAHGVTTVIAAMGPSPSPEQRAAAGCDVLDTGLPLDWLAADAAEIARAGGALAALANREHADVIQLNAPALAARARFPVPVVAVAHSCVVTWWIATHGDAPLPSDLAWRAGLHRAGLRRADRAVAPSAAFAAATQVAHGLARAPDAIHNGRGLAVPETPLHDFAFTAGRLWDPGKNLATLDRAAARLRVPLRAAGPVRGPNGAAVVFDHVHALGTVDEGALVRWLGARPVFVSAARYEPFGLAVLEAARAGCPLVLSDIPTFRELWDGAATFVDADDDAGFAAAIAAILADENERRRLGRAARARAARYTVERQALAMATLYAGLASAPAAAA